MGSTDSFFAWLFASSDVFDAIYVGVIFVLDVESDNDMILRLISDGQNNIIFVDFNAYIVDYLRYHSMGCHGYQRLDSHPRKNFKFALQRHD